LLRTELQYPCYNACERLFASAWWTGEKEVFHWLAASSCATDSNTEHLLDVLPRHGCGSAAGEHTRYGHVMAEKPLPFRRSSDSKSIFMRERIILNVANLRYELDLIAILTPLPPAQQPKLATMPRPDGKRKPRPAAKNSAIAE
jgi:hypothetical protein